MLKEKLKTYDVSKRVSPQARAVIENTLESHKYHRNTYFWNSGDCARDRRWRESRFYSNNPSYYLRHDEDIICVYPSYEESCNHVYYNLYITINNINKDVRLLKRILQKGTVRSNSKSKKFNQNK